MDKKNKSVVDGLGTVGNTANENTVADATKVVKQPVAIGAKGHSTVVGFSYTKGGWCKVSLKNGASGIVGDSATFTFPAMMMLKGTGTVVNFTRLADKGEYARYTLEWSLE